MAEEPKSSNFVVGISFHLILALLVPGAMAAVFFCWLFGPKYLLDTTGDKEFTLVNGLVFSLVFGLILTPFAFFCERWWFRNRESATKRVSNVILRAENEGLVGWYFYQVWGQSIMHWNIAICLSLLLVAYCGKSVLESTGSCLCDAIQCLNVKFLVTIFTIVFSFIASSYFKTWHEGNVSWLEKKLKPD